MTVQVDIHQERTVEEGPVFRVTTQVTYSSGISSKIFVYEVSTEEFSHVATVWDMGHFHEDKDLAQLDLQEYYRKDAAVQDFEYQEDAIVGATYTKGRVALLVETYNLMDTEFVGEDDTTYVDPEL